MAATDAEKMSDEELLAQMSYVSYLLCLPLSHNALL